MGSKRSLSERGHRGQSMVSHLFHERNGGLTTEDGGQTTEDGGLRERWGFGNLRCATKERRGKGGSFARESTRMGAIKNGRGSFRPQISRISTDGQKECPQESETGGNRCFAQNNLCESV